ncbi:hypothetical protein IID19_00970 [Patescibacteria group bacterium]|nr:hypothetical protein [Patescibacteria group bacterium]
MVIGGFSLRLLVFILIISWIFTGWPPIYINDTIQFPPPIEKVNAATEILRPNATGDSAQWTPNTSTDYGDTSDQNSSTYISESTDEDRDIMNLADPTFDSGSTINWVEMHMSCRSDGSGQGERMNGIIRLSGTDDNHLNNANISSSSFTEYTGAQVTTDPSGGAWSFADIQNIQIGGQIKTIGNGETIDCDEFWVVVDYTLPSAGITISGNVYTDEGSSAFDCSADNLTIKVSINGAAEDTDTCTASSGAYSITTSSAPSAAGDPIVLYIDSAETPNATTVTLAADTSSNITSLHLYQNRVIARHEDSGPNTNAKFGTGDNADTGIRYSVSAGALTVESGMELHIWTGDTFTPGGTVTTNATGGDLHVDDSATATLDTATNTIGRDILVDASATLNINTNTNIEGGDITTTGTSVTIATSGTPTVTMTGTGNIGGGTTPTINFYNLTIGTATAASTTVASSFTVANTLDVDTSDTLSINTSQTVSHTGTVITLDGTISGAGTLSIDDGSDGPGAAGTLSSIVRYDASAGNILSTTFDARTYNGQVEFFSSSATARTVTFATGTYTLSGASSHLYVIADGASPGDVTLVSATNNPTVTIGGDLDFTGSGSSSEVITSGTGTWTVSGNVDFTAGTYTATSGNTFQVDGTSKNLTSNGQVYDNFSITGGSITTVDQLDVSGNFNLTSGTLTQGANVDIVLTGDAVNLASGTTFTKASGTGNFIMDGISDNQSFDDANATKQDMGSVQIGMSPGTTKLKSDFSATDLTILTGDKFETHGWEVDVSDFIDCQGTCTFDLQDDAPSNEGDGTIVTFGGNWTMSGTGTFIVSTDSRVEPDGTADQTITTGSKAFFDFYSNNAGTTDSVDDVIISTGTFDVDGALTVNDGELDLETNDPTTDIEGNITIAAGAELFASSTGSFNAAGSWNNDGTLTPGSGTITFDAGTTGKTIESGGQSFNNVVFNNASGGWTVQTENMTTASDLTLTAASTFTLQTARTLEVQGNFTLTVAGANTTWTGSTLYLNGSGGMYDINTKTHGGDTFATLRIGASEDIAMWDSDASTFTIDSGGCLFSEDHAGTAGRMNIYGTCNTRTNEYWSYATDWDGAALTRQADIRFAASATLTVDSADTLEIRGQNATSNRSLVTRQSTGNYGLTMSGTIDAQYYDFDNLDASGLNITSTATITELSDGNFDNNASGASSAYITVNGITSSENFFDNVFDDNGDGTDVNVVYNVNADGSGIDWTFFGWSGNKGGEDFDNELNSAFVGWNSELNLSVSSTTVNLGVLNLTSVATGNHTITVTTNAANGYTCRVVEDGEMRNGANTINDVSDGTVTAGSEEYGINCSGADCALGSDTAITGTPLTVASNTGVVDASVTTFTYKAAASGITVYGNYAHLVTITCTGDF